MQAEDMNLLRDFATTGAEAAFTTLVQRHVNLVYAAALRRLGNSSEAEEVAQAVFLILAQKAAHLHQNTVLSGWLYRTAQLTAANYQRVNRRRQRREQEAFMQFTESSPPDFSSHHLGPALEEAMARLNTRDRDALVLRFFENRPVSEVAAALGLGEAAAQKRVNRATTRLRNYFTRRGIQVSAAALAVAIGTAATQAAPTGLAHTISAAAITHGATASASTLTLMKGALKIMAWTKTKIAMTAGIGVLFLAGTAVVTLKEIQEHRTYSWQRANFEPVPVVAPQVLGQTKPQVRIVKSKYDHMVVGFFAGDVSEFLNGAWVPAATNSAQCIGVGITADSIVMNAYHSDARHTLFRSPPPTGLFDYIANLPVGSLPALQQEIRRQWGLTGTWQTVDMPALAVTLAAPQQQAFKPANSLRADPSRLTPATLAQAGSASHNNPDGSYAETRFNESVDFLIGYFEREFNLPVINQTGLTNRYDYAITWPVRRTADPEAWLKVYRQAIRAQLGLELVATNMPVEMLVVEKAR